MIIARSLVSCTSFLYYYYYTYAAFKFYVFEINP